MLSLTRVVAAKPVAQIEARHGQFCVVLDSIVLWAAPTHEQAQSFLHAYHPVAHFMNFDRVTECAMIWLLEDRLSNTVTHYEPQDYRRIRAQRTRAKKGLLSAVATKQAIQWQMGGDRYRVRLSDGTFTYIAGASENEEITNLLRRLVDPTAEWVA